MGADPLITDNNNDTAFTHAAYCVDATRYCPSPSLLSLSLLSLSLPPLSLSLFAFLN